VLKVKKMDCNIREIPGGGVRTLSMTCNQPGTVTKYLPELDEIIKQLNILGKLLFY
jgi:hypothetical protein